MQRLLELDFESNVQETSKQSLKELDKDEISKRYQEILNAIWRSGKPLTDQEIKASLKKTDPNYVRPRRWELENKLNLISECNTRECSITHKIAKTFWPTIEGLRFINE